MQKVEFHSVNDHKTGKRRKFNYYDVEYDKDGWADSSKFLPADCDLVLIKSQDGKVYPGWRFFSTWEGANVPAGIEAIAWKRHFDREEE